MYIVAIAWLYVAILMAVTEPSVVAGLATFFFYGLAPLLLFWWVVGAPTRKRRKQRQVEAEAQAKAAAED